MKNAAVASMARATSAGLRGAQNAQDVGIVLLDAVPAASKGQERPGQSHPAAAKLTASQSAFRGGAEQIRQRRWPESPAAQKKQVELDQHSDRPRPPRVVSSVGELQEECTEQQDDGTS
jgi:hypothetical protein